MNKRLTHIILLLICLPITIWAEDEKYEQVPFGIPDIVVTAKGGRQHYQRRNNPAVELIRQVIAGKDSACLRSTVHYTAETYTRNSFALEEFTPDFNKGIWHGLQFVAPYIDTTANHALSISIRESKAKEFYQQKPLRKKRMFTDKRIYGLENKFTSDILQQNLNAMLKDIDIYDDDIELLYNRFVSPLSKILAVSFYHYYIVDTINVDGDWCTDLAFEPVNQESYGFSGHLYITTDGTHQIKKYYLEVPEKTNINFVKHLTITQDYQQLDNGLWAPNRSETQVRFRFFRHNAPILAKQTKLYLHFDFDDEIDNGIFSPMVSENAWVPADSLTLSAQRSRWETLRPEPLTRSEESVVEMLEEAQRTPKFNALIMLADALANEYVATVPSSRWGESKWDFGPIYNTVSWNPLEGTRLRIGGMTTGNLSHHFFASSYVAFGCEDLRPKYNLTLLYSFPWKKYQPYRYLRDYLRLSVQYDVEEPGRYFAIMDRDHILQSIPMSKPEMKNYQYVFRTELQYQKEWENSLQLTLAFSYENNEAAGTMHYQRIVPTQDNLRGYTDIHDYHRYQQHIQLRYTPGGHFPVNRKGQESPYYLDKNVPILTLDHFFGYLDDRKQGGYGYWFNHTDLRLENRFWLSGFGHLDTKLQAGIIWNRVPFTQLYCAPTSTGPFLGIQSFNLMQPMEFMMDKYVALYLTYSSKGWLMNRIPGLNRLKLRGVVSFSGIYGGLSEKNNPFGAQREGLYLFPQSAQYDNEGHYLNGNTLSPMGKLPYMEITAGFENIFRFIRIDYVRRLTYNDYTLPDGHQRSFRAWGRNGVKITARFDF